jgi:aerobic-type carbon monoxide dehydrogenase small subunit (CoxS/CutS family)
MALTTLTVNGRAHTVDVDPEMPLLWVLRDALNLVGTKFGCGGGFCGACTVHLDGTATRSCTTPIGKVSGRRVTTIEGLQSLPGTGNREPGTGQAGSHPVQRAWEEIDVPQCGYCQAGQMMTAAALLARTPDPTDDQIANAMNGNLCRCGTYLRIREAVKRAADLMRAEGGR